MFDVSQEDMTANHWMTGIFRALLPALLIGLVSVGASASEQFPLRPPDVSSPRATIGSLIDNLNRAYAVAEDPDVPSSLTSALLRRAARTLNLSEEPAGLRENIGIEAALHLKEIIDRVGLPPIAEIPDKAAVERSRSVGVASGLLPFAFGLGSPASTERLNQWRLPDTEIVIGRVIDGPHAGEWLFTPQTVERAEEFFRRVNDMPYLPGATPDIYLGYSMTPGPGLNFYWSQHLPEWLGQELLGQALWQWLSVALVVAAGLALAIGAYRLGRHADKRCDSLPAAQRGAILGLIVALAITLGAEVVIDQVINFTGDVLILTKQIFVVINHVLIGWVAVLILLQIPEFVIRSRHLRPRGIDSQLLRLGFKLLGLITLAVLVIDGAQRLGLPAYSVITGLGVGGLAVALAARETLANLLGSLSIMLDRPFRIGDWIKIGDDEGTVEDIGFRSTRIRTFYDSLLSIPNATTMNAVIDNMGQRTYRRVYTRLGIRYDTPPDKIEAFIEGIKGIIREHSATRKDYFHVVLNDFGEHSLDIMLYFFLEVPDWTVELIERQQVLIDILHLAAQLGVDFAFPTQTLEIERFPADCTVDPVRSATEHHRGTIASSTASPSVNGNSGIP